ncbi:MAG: hypothetical protein COW01_03375 [Bdellovibrionales bacterium CG12_big_fil_rev_8_21_14_0_65_38_15]|nr:MAG: hypothetical protein COW79_01935 [Bdellovibrionales bacterium CG22_combo_CG10-13_8_21_14_all_38_13]PIQ56886.1 MAG: hypothetical protein COW01_03375 [Bdellovibrionales bacterium CG12_big_fil_rev_8_21_14_0_65_38_15]PIR30051.1 MAG: hypothetical protein COV38_07095 [Bdellovibrionales bacterium CG11_big_fil_rev_8_21_14_0_20_38_13]
MRNDLKALQGDNTKKEIKTSRFVLGLDLEGINENLVENGVNLDLDRVTEIGAVLWDVERNQPIKILSELIDEPDHLPLDEDTTELTGIDDAMLEQWGAKGKDIKIILEKLVSMIGQAEAIVAHNGGNYDRPMIEAMAQRHGVQFPDKLWIDTGRDIEFPKKMHMRSMAALEHAHGFVNPFPHRAVTDVLSMMKIFSTYPYERIHALASSPVVKIVADLKAPNWKDQSAVTEFNRVKNKVAKARFRWNPSDKTWSKDIHQILIDEGKINFEFDWSVRA